MTSRTRLPSTPVVLGATLILALPLGACRDADGQGAPDQPQAALVQESPSEAPQALQDAAQQVDASRRTAIVQAANRVAPAVVTVNTRRTERVQPRSLWESFFLPPGAARRVAGLGSGFVIDGDQGYVLTNNHVVEGADSVMVTFPDGRDFPATVVGTDPVTDVAVIQLQGDGPFPEAPLGTSEGLLIGEWVVAIGNPFGYLLSNTEPTVTTGVVSAVGRDIVPDANSGEQGSYLGMIQTDASINPGNSGGPLVNVLGQVIGVNSSIFSRSGGSEGLGFAIPIDRALRSARDLMATGTVHRAWLGVDVQPAEADSWGRTRGVLVSRVVGGSPAQKAGLRPGRRILDVNGHRLAVPLDWQDVMLDLRPGDQVELHVEGSDQPLRLTATTSPLEDAERVTALDEMQVISLTPQIRGELGVAAEQGAVVVKVSDAIQAQLDFREGDVIVRINGTAITSAQQAASTLDGLGPGRVEVILERGGSYVTHRFIWR